MVRLILDYDVTWVWYIHNIAQRERMAMTLTYELDATAETYKTGLFASRISAVLDRAPGSALSEPDRQLIKAAMQSVRDLLLGAETLHPGHSVSGATANSIKSLGMALPPLQSLQKLSGQRVTSDEVIISYLTKMEAALSELAGNETLPTLSDELSLAREFFGVVADTLLSSLSKGRRHAPDTLSFA